MIRVICVRHGETEWNRTHRLQGRSEVALASSGVKQARAAGLYVRSQNPSAGYVSTLQRTHATFAEFGLGFDPEEKPGLIEQSLGDWEGMKTVEAKSQYAELYTAWKTGEGTPPSGEANSAVVARMRESFFEIIRGSAELPKTSSADTDYDLRTVVIVSHGTSTKALLEGLGLIDRTQVISLSAAAITVIDVPLHGGPLSSSLPKGGTAVEDSAGGGTEAEVIRSLSDRQIRDYAKLRMYNLSAETLAVAADSGPLRT